MTFCLAGIILLSREHPNCPSYLVAVPGFLSNFLKKDRKLERKRKYTRLMSKFIEERNKYAHGVFCFLVPQRVWLIQYSDNSGTKQWADVDLATIQSFIDTSFELSDWLVEISRRLDKLKY